MMRVIFVQTYPLYHDGWSLEQWIRLYNRDRWMPGLAASLGREAELWVVGEERKDLVSRIPDLCDYPIRVFPADRTGGATKRHTSRALIRFAAQDPADLFVLKGVDGGVGEALIDAVLEPDRRPYAMVIGGKYYTRNVARAAAVLYETERQKRLLMHPAYRIWRRPVPPERLIRLPKSIDTDVFRPMADAPVEWDVISVARLISKHKYFDAAGKLSERVRVAVVGGGPLKEALRRRYPRVAWLGKTPHHLLPALLNKARVFLHSGLSDYYPRVIPEAMACGLPCVAFKEAIDADVLPAECGLRVSRKDFIRPVLDLLGDENRRISLGEAARRRAVSEYGRDSSRPALEKLLALPFRGPGAD